MDLPKHYKPEESEPKWQKFWEEEKINSFDPENVKKEVYSIDTPPPTVSGKMHMGHAFSNSQQDFIARYKRMKGFNVLQPLGTDDNGLPTKLLVEKIKGVKASKMSRKEFVELVIKTLEEELRPSYIADWKRLGISCDYNVFYTTINEHCRKISQKSFIELYKKGRQYRKKAPAMYCPKCQTAISQVECEDKSVSSFFNDIVFKVGEEELIIATTRPELLPACVAVFYHPDDKRYQKLKGKKAKVPLFDFKVPILEDERADPEKGTGIVMCCTFGDSTDVEWQKAHDLPIKEAINKEGKMTPLAGKYEGMSIETARKMMIDDMKDQRLLISQEPINHDVNVHERCGTQIEFVNSKQWFVKYLDLKEDMLKWGEEFKWHPEHMKNRYDNWVNGLQWDWLISRQLPYGIPFPVWYCEDCEEVILAKEKDLPVDPLEDSPPVNSCPQCGSRKIIPEEDIINTWATSSLTPTIVKELFKGKPVYEKLNKNPMDLRPQGHDIISFWLFNTVVKSKLHYDMIPWKNAFISGWMLDPKGKKMSKSKGNVVEPRDMIEKYSADALRFMSSGSKLGEDLAFPEKDIMTGQKTVTKLWNASKFALMHLEDYDNSCPELRMVDKWAVTKLHKLIKKCTEYFDNYDYSHVRQEVDKFFWQVLCENYLEIAKDRLYNPDVWGEEQRKAAQCTLNNLVLSVLKMFAPFLPHITEEIYQLHFVKNGEKSIHISSWPEYHEQFIDKDAERIGDILIKIVEQVRKIKSDKQVSMKTPIKTLNLQAPLNDEEFKSIALDLEKTLNIESIEFSEGDLKIECEF